MQIHQFEGYIQDIYLVEYDHGLMLLDGCSRADVQLICDYIENELSRPISDLKLVISTHMHPDHAGAAQHLKKKTGCLIAAADVAGHWYTGINGYLMFITDMLLAKWVAKRKGKKAKYLWYNRKLKPDIALQDNQAIPNFEDWICLFTQGHTDRCISLFNEKINQVYVADLMVKVRGKLIPPFPVFYPNRYKASLNRLWQLEPAHYILAHGGINQMNQSEFEALIEKAPNIPATHWRSVKKKLLKALS
jgi:glyoxylase-like metal-dependent hydrolase (beta-lactamase superfamily II)